MITTELFLITQLFSSTEVSWYWILFFIISDSMMWSGLKKTIRGD